MISAGFPISLARGDFIDPAKVKVWKYLEDFSGSRIILYTSSEMDMIMEACLKTVALALCQTKRSFLYLTEPLQRAEAGKIYFIPYADNSWIPFLRSIVLNHAQAVIFTPILDFRGSAISDSFIRKVKPC